MSIASEITRLQNAKADIKTAIEAKGVEIPSNATLDEYSDYVEEIPSGGGKPSTVEELNVINEGFFQTLLDIPKNYPTYTQDNVTLYTPDVNCQCYVIAKRSGGKYCVAWFKVKNSDIGLSYRSNYNNLAICEFSYVVENSIYEYYKHCYYDKTGFLLYRAEYNTIEECIQAIQSNQTTYTKSSSSNGLSIISDVEYIVPYCNYAINTNFGAGGARYFNENFISTRKISSNETIQVIS